MSKLPAVLGRLAEIKRQYAPIPSEFGPMTDSKGVQILVMAEALEEARALLDRLEWSGLDMSSDPDSMMGRWACCPFCQAPEGNRHGPNCELAKALGR